VNILAVDQNFLVSINHALVGRSDFLDKILEFIAVYLVYALPVILILMWFLGKKYQKATAFSFISAVFSWFLITKSIVPKIWFRPRPDLDLIGVKELLFHRPDYSFPSDHATALFAITLGLYLFGWKKAGNWFLLYSCLIVTARVAIGVHFPLDIIGGIVSALIGVAIFKILEKPLEKTVFKPVQKYLKKIRLA
jgi:undecaprenyl-diphosphatase